MAKVVKVRCYGVGSDVPRKSFALDPMLMPPPNQIGGMPNVVWKLILLVGFLGRDHAEALTADGLWTVDRENHDCFSSN